MCLLERTWTIIACCIAIELHQISRSQGSFTTIGCLFIPQKMIGNNQIEIQNRQETHVFHSFILGTWRGGLLRNLHNLKYGSTSVQFFQCSPCWFYSHFRQKVYGPLRASGHVPEITMILVKQKPCPNGSQNGHKTLGNHWAVLVYTIKYG